MVGEAVLYDDAPLSSFVKKGIRVCGATGMRLCMDEASAYCTFAPFARSSAIDWDCISIPLTWFSMASRGGISHLIFRMRRSSRESRSRRTPNTLECIPSL